MAGLLEMSPLPLAGEVGLSGPGEGLMILWKKVEKVEAAPPHLRLRPRP
ncbi:MAG: hypothetical protein ACI8P0_004391, partial [Planctomycetaceae bacterium]